MMNEGRTEQALTGKDCPLPNRQSDQPILRAWQQAYQAG